MARKGPKVADDDLPTLFWGRLPTGISPEELSANLPAITAQLARWLLRHPVDVNSSTDLGPVLHYFAGRHWPEFEASRDDDSELCRAPQVGSVARLSAGERLESINLMRGVRTNVVGPPQDHLV